MAASGVVIAGGMVLAPALGGGHTVTGLISGTEGAAIGSMARDATGNAVSLRTAATDFATGAVGGVAFKGAFDGAAAGVSLGVSRFGTKSMPDVMIKIDPKALHSFDGDFATKQLLGTSTTPGGRTIMFHAADRMVNAPKGRLPISPTELDKILDGATRVVKRSYHPDGDTLTIVNSNMPGKPSVIVDAETGAKIITVINPKK